MFSCRPLPFLDLSLPFLDLSLPFLDISLPFLDLSLPFLDISLPLLDLPVRCVLLTPCAAAAQESNLAALVDQFIAAAKAEDYTEVAPQINALPAESYRIFFHRADRRKLLATPAYRFALPDPATAPFLRARSRGFVGLSSATDFEFKNDYYFATISNPRVGQQLGGGPDVGAANLRLAVSALNAIVPKPKMLVMMGEFVSAGSTTAEFLVSYVRVRVRACVSRGFDWPHLQVLGQRTKTACAKLSHDCRCRSKRLRSGQSWGKSTQTSQSFTSRPITPRARAAKGSAMEMATSASGDSPRLLSLLLSCCVRALSFRRLI